MTALTPSAAIIGSTGLVGSFILSNILAVEALKPIHTITRRAPKSSSPNLNAIIDADTSKWAATLASIKPTPSAVFSALGTTRAAAGGIENQWKIDHDLNVELAKAAKEAGSKTYVFISSAGTRGFPSSYSPYSKMKNGVEDAIQALGFDQSIILKPGLILGERDQQRSVEGWVQSATRSLPFGFQDKIGQEAEIIARAAIRAAQLADEGKAPSKHWVVEASEILRLGRTEWPANESKE
ncbi:Protein FMP52 [Cladobotryum mycophilum]|uniref:Protein FMP52 n=1 Tax=Cladobotryum mycophilum TaxID=491253 RepID=A0ABR0STZ4_9HYPO